MLGKSLSMEYIYSKMQSMSLRKKRNFVVDLKYLFEIEVDKNILNQRKEEQNKMKKIEKKNNVVFVKKKNIINMLFLW